MKHCLFLTNFLIFFFCLTVNLEPNANCVRLDEFTEVVVSPKTRTFPQPKKDQQVSVPTGKEITTQDSSQAHEQEHAATSTASVSYFEDSDSQLLTAGTHSCTTDLGDTDYFVKGGFMSSFTGYLHTLLYPDGEENPVSENQTSKSLMQKGSSTPTSTSTQSIQKCNGNIPKEADFDMCIRVQPELTMNSNKSSKINISKSTAMNSYPLQPTVVFVDFASLPPVVLKSWIGNLTTFPPPDGTIVKTVQISRLLSPKERAASRTNSASTNSRDNVGSTSRDSTNQESDSSNRGIQGELYILLITCKLKTKHKRF